MEFEFESAPVLISKIQPMLENHDKTQIKTVRIHMEMNRSSHFQGTLFEAADGDMNKLEGALWDEAENKRPGVKQITFDKKFTGVDLTFVEAASNENLVLSKALVEKITAKPISGKALQIKFQALAVVQSGDLEHLHDILKSQVVSLTAKRDPELAEVA